MNATTMTVRVMAHFWAAGIGAASGTGGVIGSGRALGYSTTASEVSSVNAIVFSQTGGPEVLRLSEVPKPEVRPGMVLIRVHAVGVNFADTRFRQGTYVVKPKRPDTPGLEAAGSSRPSVTA